MECAEAFRTSGLFHAALRVGLSQGEELKTHLQAVLKDSCKYADSEL
jgi:hypothetical protein